MNQYAPVTDEDRAEMARLHAEGHGRNEIARRVNRAQRTVSVECAKMNLIFDVTMTEIATRHRVAHLEEKRSILADALTDDALRLSEQAWQPTTVFHFGGKDNTYEEKTFPEAPAAEKRLLMTAATAAAAESRRLVPPSEDTGAAAGRSMIGQLMAGLRSVYDEQTEEGAAATEEAEGESP